MYANINGGVSHLRRQTKAYPLALSDAATTARWGAISSVLFHIWLHTMTDKNTRIYYRSNCNDGKGAALAAWLKLGSSASYQPIGYFDKFPAVRDFKGKHVYILNFSFDLSSLAVIAEHAASVTVITRRDLTDIKGKTLQKCKVIIDESHSGSMLAWRYFFPNKEPPMLFTYLQDYDLWRHEHEESKYIIQALYSEQQFDFAKWYALLADDMLLKELTHKGKILYEHELNTAHSLLKKSWRLQVIDNAPYHMLTVVNAPLRIISKLGEAHRSTGNSNPVLAYQTFEKRCSISLRNGCVGIDLGVLASTLAGYNSCRGGGHFGAAGISPKCHFHEMAWKESR